MSLAFAALLASAAWAATGNIDPAQKFAWSENAGWINFAPMDGGVSVQPSYLSGYAWCETAGWVKLGAGAGPYANTSASDWGVNVNASGNLSGCAWAENAGWINLNPKDGGVTINADGTFDGYAWSETLGWMHFKNGAPAYNVALPIPVITSATTADGTVGQAFSYTITATKNPTNYNATPLPAGLQVNTSTGAITGTPTTAGVTDVTISATNAGGTGTANLRITISDSGSPNRPPRITAGPAVTPNPVYVGNSTSLTLSATDDDGDALSFAWDFADGSNGSGNAVSHTYTEARTYNATVTVSDGKGGTASASVSVNVTTPPPEAPVITSGPNVSPNPVQAGYEVLFSAAASDPQEEVVTLHWDFGDSTSAEGGAAFHTYNEPGNYVVRVTAVDTAGNTSVASVVVTVTGAGGGGSTTMKLTLTKLSLKLNFQKTGQDRVQVQGIMDIPADFVPAGTRITADICGVVAEFMLDPKGNAKTDVNASKNNRFKVSLKFKKKVLVPGQRKFSIKMQKGDFRTPLEKLGLVNKDVKDRTITMPVRLVTPRGAYLGYLTGKYSALGGKGGSGAAKGTAGLLPGR